MTAENPWRHDASALAIITLLVAIAFASIYLYVLSYRETRAQLK